jgi:hypothetical protein
MNLKNYFWLGIITQIFFAWFSSDIHSQDKIVIGSIYVTASERIHYFQTLATGDYDQSWPLDKMDTELISMGLQSGYNILTNYTQSADTISMIYNGYNHVSFILDTTNKKLLNFSFSFSRDEPSGNTSGHFISAFRSGYFFFGSLDFQSMGDTLISLTEYGKKCKEDLTAANWSYEMVAELNGYVYDRYELDSLINDTSKYSLSIALVSQKPINSVSSSKSVNDTLGVSYSANHSIHFLYPSSDHPQPLTIYDLLGREVKRIEIPSGVSEYSLPQGQLPSGYYFARLGNMGAKFMVY